MATGSVFMIYINICFCEGKAVPYLGRCEGKAVPYLGRCEWKAVPCRLQRSALGEPIHLQQQKGGQGPPG